MASERRSIEDHYKVIMSQCVSFYMMEASAAAVLRTEVVTEQPEKEEELVLRLRSEPPADRPRVTWAADVVGEGLDNEHLGRLKSNCCCIYTRPRVWDDPTTWEQDEAEVDFVSPQLMPQRTPARHVVQSRSMWRDMSVKRTATTEHCRGHTLPPPPKPKGNDETPPQKQPADGKEPKHPCC